MLLVAACGTSTATPTPAAGEPAATAGATGGAQNGDGTGVVTEVEPYPLDQTTGPVRLQIPEIDLDVPIIAMGWRVDVVNGQRATVWDVPLEEAGWHINSAGAGAAGNTIVSGRQVGGAALFAPLALGSVVPGQEVLLTDGDGIIFVYRVTEVTEPVAVTGATSEEIAEAATYYAPSDDARLTLVTGWPEFTTTHRIFVVAEFVGVLR
jgi:sortase (surface protein transpeptidase)